MKRSACSAMRVRFGSMTINRAPPFLARRLDLPREMQVGHRDVVAPHHDQVGVADLLRRHPRRRAVEARVGGAAHESRRAVRARAATPPACGRTGGPSSRRPARRADRRSSAAAPPAGRGVRWRRRCRHGPGPGPRPRRSAGTRPRRVAPIALQRPGEPPGTVHELRIRARHLVADDAGRVGIGAPSRARRGHATPSVATDRLQVSGQSSGQTLCRTAAGVGGGHGEVSCCSSRQPFRPVDRGCESHVDSDIWHRASEWRNERLSGVVPRIRCAQPLRPAIIAASERFATPRTSKLSSASHLRRMARTSGHSSPRIEYHAVSRSSPLQIMWLWRIPSNRNAKRRAAALGALVERIAAPLHAAIAEAGHCMVQHEVERLGRGARALHRRREPDVSDLDHSVPGSGMSMKLA